MLTLFTWGYWGWGGSTRSTCKLVQAVDITEKKRGYKPPMFVDIRLRRSGLAKAFVGNAFERVVGSGRYQWIPRLGNKCIATGEPGIKIADPSAVNDLLELAIKCDRQNRRVLFFCACLDLKVKKCHRSVVANLLLREAARLARRIEIVEWPGDKPTYNTRVKVVSSLLKDIGRGQKTVPLSKSPNLKEFAGLPWGSVVTLQSNDQALSIVSGPAKYHGEWCLQVVRPGKGGGDAERLKEWGVGFREKKGLEYRRSLEGSIHTR
jgi:hypothetical protein